ncbi:hypothetical protein CFK37_03280 [Virgibacillus phasianinus]|uniref:PepSY domain-containing protein n=1 Tax=Virgibacillus phasianinus TaxID=2017483 RepID=A0A220TZR0_9BACI|nr:PepSY domain-containing protein [Virgibacillus phasianinus]ASK61269.1 hypothetical protein CFK37_03280 [Virgibacillus phasianinus]
MGKKKKITAGAIIAAAVLGFGIYNSSTSQAQASMSSDDIRKLVEDQYPGKITELELDKEKNKAVYEVEISGKDKEYELKLDGSTGEVLHLQEKPISKDQPDDTDADDDKDVKAEKQQNNDTKAANKAVIEYNKAEEIARKEFDGKVTSIELDEDDGHLIYEVEVKKGKKEAEIDINAYTGEVIVVSIEQDED